MATSETLNLLKKKIIKILGFLILIRLGLYIPIPNIDLDIFSQNQITNPLFGFAKNLTGSSFLGIGSLGILPYINSSIVIQLLTPVIPKLEKLQKEIDKYEDSLQLVESQTAKDMWIADLDHWISNSKSQISELGNLGIRECGNLETWERGNL